MAGLLLVPGAWPVFDAAGDPVSGATISFFRPGTTTPKIVYSNDAFTTSLGSVLTTNAAGEPTTLAGVIAREWWGSSNQSYDIRIQADGLDRSWNNIPVDSSGGGSVDQVWKTIEEFGAVGDGTTNDTAALVAAGLEGGSVYFDDAKTYMVDNGQIQITQPNTRWLGKGTIKFLPSQTGTEPKINILEAATDCYFEVSFDGNQANQTYVYNGLWEIDCYAPRFTYANGKMINCQSGGIRLFSNAHGAKILNCYADDIPDGFVVGYNFPGARGPNSGTISTCVFNRTSCSVRLCSNWLVEGNKGAVFNFRTPVNGNNAGGGFTVFDPGGTSVANTSYDNVVVNNDFDLAGVIHGFGLSLTGARNVVIGNTIRNATAIGIECFDGVVTNNTVIDCMKGYSFSQGTAATSLTVSDNTCSYNIAKLCTVTNAVWSNTSGGQATITLTGNLGFLIGANARYNSSGVLVYGAPNSVIADRVTIFNIVSSGSPGFNGEFDVVSSSYNSGTNTTTLIVAMPSGSSVGTYTSGGKIVPVAAAVNMLGDTGLPNVNMSDNTFTGPIQGVSIQRVLNLRFNNNKSYVDGVIKSALAVFTCPNAEIKASSAIYVNQPTLSNTTYGYNFTDCLAANISDNTVLGDTQLFGAIQVSESSGSSARTHLSGNHVRAQSRGISTNNLASIYLTNNHGAAGIPWDVGALVNQFNNVTDGGTAGVEATMKISTDSALGFTVRGNTANVISHTGTGGAYLDFNAGGSATFVQARNGNAYAKWFECDGNSSSTFHGVFVRPGVDNNATLGESGSRWSAVWAANGTIQTSDKRQKNHVDFVDPATALEFIGRVDPAFFRWKVGGIDRVLIEEAEVERTLVRKEYTDVDGNLIPAVYDTKLIKEAVYEDRPIPGRRTHAGFYAQDVKTAMDEMGLDWGAWGLDDVNDPDSRQNMRPDQLIPILWAAVQGLQQQVKDIEEGQS